MTESPVSFASLGVSAPLCQELDRSGISEPFPIQELAIADALSGRDVCGQAKTGSGKTLAFGLPLLQNASVAAGPGRPVALVLVPTRELAAQVSEVMAPLGKVLGLRVGSFYGGANMDRQIEALRRGVDVAIATPGRLIDLGDRGELSVGDVTALVLDEADRMADMGFMPQVEWVLRRLPEKHQTLLFSATLDGDVERLRSRYMSDPVEHRVSARDVTVSSMLHRFLSVHQMDKVKVAAAITQGVYRTLIFVRTKRGADRLVGQLQREGIKAGTIHGDLRQNVRERAIKDFADGKLAALVATDVAARGIHIDGIDVVIHYDPPEDHKGYLHRSGRTARAGEEGVVATLVLWDQVVATELLQRRLGLSEPMTEVFSNDPRLRDLVNFGLRQDVVAGSGSSIA
ncbi:MAG: DEAD/DEAH box helicase [Acidimicrobiales bacterium]